MFTMKKSVAKQHYGAVIKALKKGVKPATSGEFIRAKLVQGTLTTDEVVSETKRHYKGSTVKVGDVYWNRSRLKQEGIRLSK